MSAFEVAGQSYRIDTQPPPGAIVAPDGFPADPYPKNAPKVFQNARDVRVKVFCHEQRCSLQEELDIDDPRSWSWVIYQLEADGTETAVSTIRIVPPPHPDHPNGFRNPDEPPYIKLTRVATIASARGRGLSRILIEKAFQVLGEQPELIGHEWKGLVLTHAQVDVERMYMKMGFVTDEQLGKWVEEGIDHIGMWRTIDTNP